MGAVPVPSRRLVRFKRDIERGMILLMADIPHRRVAEIEALMQSHNPEAHFEGHEPNVPSFPWSAWVTAKEGQQGDHSCRHSSVQEGQAVYTIASTASVYDAVMYVSQIQASEECMAQMPENCLHHLPVMEGERLLGLILIGDLVKGII